MKTMDENGNPVEGGSDGKYTYHGDHLNKDVFAQNKYIYNSYLNFSSIINYHTRFNCFCNQLKSLTTIRQIRLQSDSIVI